MSRSPLFYQKLGVKGLEKLAEEYKVNDDLPFVKKLIKKNDHVLDLGCGYGRVTIPLVKAGYSVAGLDISKNLIQAARLSAKRAKVKIDFTVGDMTKLPYKKDGFDKIICLWNGFNELLTKTHQVKALQEICRVLKPKGSAFLVMRDGDSKELKEEISKNGRGPGRRIVSNILLGVKSSTFVHDRKSFTELCVGSNFHKCKVEFKKINGRRRLVALLYK